MASILKPAYAFYSRHYQARPILTICTTNAVLAGISDTLTQKYLAPTPSSLPPKEALAQDIEQTLWHEPDTSKGATAAENTAGLVQSKVDQAKDRMGQVASEGKETAKEKLNQQRTKASEAVEEAKENVKDNAKKTVQSAKDGSERIKESGEQTVKDVKERGINAAKDVVGDSHVKAGKDTVESANSQLKDKASEVKDKAHQMASDSKDKVKEVVDGKKGQVSQKVDQAKDKVKDAVDETKGKVSQKTQDMKDKAKDAVDETKGQVSQKTQGMKDKAKGAVDEMKGQVSQKTQDVKEQVQNTAQSAKDMAANHSDIPASPPLDMPRLGRFMLYNFSVAPLIHTWYSVLDKKFPVATAIATTHVTTTGVKNPSPPSSKLVKALTPGLKRMVADQALFAPVGLALLFGGLTVMEGGGVKEIKDKLNNVRRETGG